MKHIKKLERELCGMGIWITGRMIVEISSNHFVYSASRCAQRIRREELSVDIWREHTDEDRLILTLLGRAMSEHEA